MKWFIVSILFLITGCSSQAQFNKTKLGKALEKIQTQGGALSENEIAMGLKEALKVGISNGSEQASQTDGYLKNEFIKILFPPDARRVEERLRQIGLGNEVDRFVMSLNRAAEDAAKRSKPIFVSAITSMTITDAVGILKGDETAATEYLRRTTNDELYQTFFPVVDSTLNLNQATKYYADLVNTYNKIPLVQKVNPDLKQYATQKAMDGLFVLIAQEEKKIRQDPAARINDILRRVFGQAKP
ncbi:DUF4197 domain-containing protein [Arundinibacter roseus]|uniref:DUF4197 domain-containing protein n=1 Tax=Arundinibacter roseus TaxID=2070510 RepID=A0A4R4KJD4_9BACT|nr:DUF4197 domain-containing protein [Arundinibacter roseus]TDB67002.1 DUF4197 domain-containing protein [Arundinibacter roseus]